MRTLFITVPYAVNVRDVLRSDIFTTLLRAGHRVVILSPAHADPAFVKEFSRPNVFIEPLVDHKPSAREVWYDELRLKLFPDLTKTFTMKVQQVGKRGVGKAAAVHTAIAAARLLGRRRTRQILASLNARLFPDPYYGELFERYRPDLVCLTRVFPWASDYYVLKQAVRQNVPTVLLVASWDNLTSKGVLPAPIDRMVVWNDIMKDEAVALHDMASEDVFVGGVPQFDPYFDRSLLPDRNSFFRRIGADPTKRLLTFTLTIKEVCPHEWESVEVLWEEIRAGAIAEPCQLLVRQHPQSKPDEVPLSLRGQPGLFFEIPGRATAFMDRDPSLEDLRHLAATMWHSDVVLNTTSTISIDAAAFDTPVVCVGFDGKQDLPYEKAARRYYDYTHFRKLLDTGGARVVYSAGEMTQAVNDYLRDRSLDRDARQRLVREQCHRLDGQSGARIGLHLLDLVETLASRPARRAEPATA